MFTLFIVLAIIVSILLILIVLIQNPKGGGIAANFSAANQIAGVKRTNDFVEKATWTLAIALFVFSLGTGYLHGSGDQEKSIIQERLENAPAFEGEAPLNTDQAVPLNNDAPIPAPAE